MDPAPSHKPHHRRFEGPGCWAASLLLGLLIGYGLSLVLPGEHPGPTETSPTIPLWLCVPFVLLLASIALMPFINSHFWHHHFPDFAFLLGGVVAGYYLSAFSPPGSGHGLPYGQSTLLHALTEYYSFIALVGGLFVVAGGILIDAKGRATPLINTAFLALGALLANLVGTTGASVLLIGPFMRINAGRLRPIHIVMYIFIISNCAGCLTPIGDPPLYLGYLKGVPFFWTLEHLWGDWVLVVGLLLGFFYLMDRRIGPGPAPPDHAGDPDRFSLSIRGSSGLFCLALMVLGVFIDPMLKRHAGIEGIPIGATFQLVVAAVSYKLAPRDILAANSFSFFPVKEVGLLFFGIFTTMAPALGYLSTHGDALGLNSSTGYFFGTGALSAVLDNAPTYLNFLQIAFGPAEINAPSMREFLSHPHNARTLHAISTGAVFFGAMTYIGNGPNFMVKAIAESALVRMPSFLGYLGYSLLILLPLLVLNWFVMFVLVK
jgi:Na+/H+ antiporter NhaD/arsenite permease-like protein